MKIIIVALLLVIINSIIIATSGAGIYVERSGTISNQAVANNTALMIRDCYRCRDRLNFYCYSNTTHASPPTIVLPDGRAISSGTSYYNYVIDPVHPSGIRFRGYTTSTPSSGIYTCRMPDSHGGIMEMSIGGYSSDIG